MNTLPRLVHLATIVALWSASCASGAVTLFWGAPDAWQEAAGPYSSIGFDELPSGTFVTTQYQELGIVFAQGDDNVTYGDITFPTDGAGLDGNLSILLLFSQPMNWLAMDYPGGLKIQLFSGGQSFYTSPIIPPGAGIGNFAGIVSTQSFDSVLLYDWLQGSDVYLDNLYFGAPVPAPGAVALLGVALVAGSRRRR